MVTASKTSYARVIRFTTKGGVHNLKPKSRRGVKIAVEALDLSSKEVHQFESAAEAARYLAKVLNIDDFLENHLRKLSVSITLYIRKSQPTPYCNHLFRVKSNKPQDWPDYSHVDMTRVLNSYKQINYPVYLKNIKTKKVIECKTRADITKVANFTHVSRAIERKSTNKGYRIYNSRQEAMDDAGRRYSNAHKYVYRVTDSKTGLITQFDTVETLSVRLKEKRQSIIAHFSISGSNVVYYGKDNRYKIERNLTNAKVTRELINILETLQSIKEQSQTNYTSDLIKQIIKAAQALKTKGMS